jgi:hypothetical protein
METETTEKKVTTKQIVHNVSEEQKETLQQLKTDYNLTDKGVIALLLEVAFNNQVGLMPDEDGNTVEVDTFAVVVKGLGLAKKEKVEKVLLTDDEKLARREARKLERKQKKLEAALAELTAKASENPVEDEDDAPEPLVVG